MAIPQNKNELLAAIETTYSKLAAELEAVPADRADEASLEGHARGTMMSAHNLVAYLVGWNELVLKWLREKQAGREVDFPETGFKWNELGRLAQKFYKDYEAVPYQALVQRLAEAKAEIVNVIESRDDAALYGEPWYEKWTMGRMIQLNTASPYTNARARLRKWKRGWT